ncbi:hypothetical protein BTO32_15475 [Marinobacter lutaoensis]|uniref:Uncharacterized protein n=1 Tax=Marinobacter lutaoensis TaxID=135739 RepID=A0A1V2DQF7_9GAMM|nr:hypothetical protein [Marinobacter lutaoensis]ONF42606.1 hypothetical protein BTO32_15475 [Marinobacter lutaoensis]
MKGKQVMINAGRFGTYWAGVAMVFVMSSSAVLADTIGEEIQRQKRLAELDHTINVNERLLEIKKQESEFRALRQEERKPAQASNTEGNWAPNAPGRNGNVQVQYFGQQPMENAGGIQRRQLNPDGTLAEEIKTPEQIQREKALEVLEMASVREAFPVKGEDGLVAIVELSDRVVEVRKGNQIGGWVVTNVALDRVEFSHSDIGETKTIYRAR